MQLDRSLPGGVGIGFRPETAWVAAEREHLALTEVVAERLMPAVGQKTKVPAALRDLVERSVPAIPHGISLSLGSAEPPDSESLSRLARVAEALDAPVISEHISFVRAGEVDVGHLTALPRSQEMLEVLIENVRLAEKALPVPLVLENIATLFEWPHAEMDEPAFIRTLLEETSVGLLLDVSNLYANSLNHGFDAIAYLDSLPLDRVVYMHIAGGVSDGGLYHDTHAHAVSEGPMKLLAHAVKRGVKAPVLLERDHGFPSSEELVGELDQLEEIMGAHVAN